MWKTSNIKLLSYLKERFLSPEIIKEVFVFQENVTYSLRSGNHLARKNIQPTQSGIESVSNLGANLWNLSPRQIKNISSLIAFKNKIRKWTCIFIFTWNLNLYGNPPKLNFSHISKYWFIGLVYTEWF